MRDIIIGTAGHIDHGKTSLIEAMTGYNGDELAQEQEQGITIDLSFCNLQENGVNIAFIDVPGHEKLIKNMVSGAFGFDATLLVVDAKEGIMPQTKEHLAILKLLGIKRLIIAISKSDLVDNELLERVKQNIKEFIDTQYSYFDIQAIIPTSIYDKESIKKLKIILSQTPNRELKESPFFRYYIDRLFSVKGIGTVVTGTVLSGTIKRKDKINIAQLNRPATVKNIQIHSQDRDIAYTHQRVALNLDTPHHKLKKGWLLCSKGYFRGFDRVDVYIESIGDNLPPHNSDILFITGAMRVEGKILYYEDKNYASIKLKEKIFTLFEDRFIILQGGRLRGGGKILIPISEPIRKKSKLLLLQALDKKDFKSAFEILLQNHKRGFGLISSFQRFNMSHQEAINIAKEIENSFLDEDELVLYPKDAMDKLKESIINIYENNPKALLSPTSINLRIKWASYALIESVLDELVKEDFLQKRESLFAKSNQDIDELMNNLDQKIYDILQNGSLTPEAPYNIYDSLYIDRKEGDKVLKALTKSKKVVRLSHNLFVTTQNLQKALNMMREIIKDDGFIDIRNFKAKSGMSRKYCIAYLEYLDSLGEVKKEKDKRVFK